MRFTPITSLLIGAALLLLGKRLAQRQRINEMVGLSLSLCMVALALALIPNSWQVWLAGGEAGDRALTFARELGLTGLFFLAGTRFDANEIWKARRISLFVAATVALLVALIATLLTVSWGSDFGAVVVAAAAISGTSLWLPGQLGLVSEKGAIAAAPGKCAAAALTVLSLLAVYLYAALHGLAARRLSASAYAVVILYELVKVAVALSFAYFVATRFLTRAEDRASSGRIVIGYLLMATLIFTMARLVSGPFGGAAWSFIAGAVLVRKGPGSKLTAASRPVTSIAVAVLLSFAFLPLLLQSHGRSLNDKTLVFSLVSAALVCKFAAAWAGARMAGALGAEARKIAAATLASGEVGILLLGFGVTRWAIDGQLYFGILTFAFISMLLSPVLWRFAADESVDFERGDEAQPRSERRSRPRAAPLIVMIGAGLFALAPTARAQSPGAGTDDPVARAMAKIQATVNDRAEAADRALAASKLVKESAEAKQQGDLEQALEALERAEKMIAEDSSAWRSYLVEERIIDQTGIRDFDEMARRGLLPLETRNYVPAVLAVWSQIKGDSNEQEKMQTNRR